jgi:hypothetical protein
MHHPHLVYCQLGVLCIEYIWKPRGPQEAHGVRAAKAVEGLQHSQPCLLCLVLQLFAPHSRSSGLIPLPIVGGCAGGWLACPATWPLAGRRSCGSTAAQQAMRRTWHVPTGTHLHIAQPQSAVDVFGGQVCPLGVDHELCPLLHSQRTPVPQACIMLQLSAKGHRSSCDAQLEARFVQTWIISRRRYSTSGASARAASSCTLSPKLSAIT